MCAIIHMKSKSSHFIRCVYSSVVTTQFITVTHIYVRTRVNWCGTCFQLSCPMSILDTNNLTALGPCSIDMKYYCFVHITQFRSSLPLEVVPSIFVWCVFVFSFCEGEKMVLFTVSQFLNKCLLVSFRFNVHST